MPRDHSCDHRFRFARWLLIPLLAFSVAFAAACGGDGDNEDGPGDVSARLDPVSAESLTGKTFISTDVKGEELVPGTRITMSFGPGALTASAGCNSMRGPLEFEKNGAFRLGRSAGTLLGCPEDRQKQDEWLTTVLSVGLRPYREDGKLLLLGLGLEIEMEEGTVPGGAPPVVGTTWELNGYDDAKGNVVSMKPGVRLPFIRFKENDSFQLFDGCNSGGGTAKVNEDGSIVFGPVQMARIACPGSTGDVSRAIQKVIQGKAAYAFEAQNLVISRQGSSLTYAPG